MGSWAWTSTSVEDLIGNAPEARAVNLLGGMLVDGGRKPKQDTTVEVRCVAGAQE